MLRVVFMLHTEEDSSTDQMPIRANMIKLLLCIVQTIY